MPWASFGPWQSHLGPPGAPSWPEVASFEDFWGHFGAHVGDCRRLFDAGRLQEPNMEGSSRHSESEAAFSSILGSLEVPRRVLGGIGPPLVDPKSCAPLSER